MADEKSIYERDAGSDILDPDEIPIKNRKVVIQSYDLVIESLIDQIGNGTIFLRPMTGRPNFQRKYVWTDKLASKLIESVLLNVPIPPCYLAQNDDFEMDVIDGQQRLFSIFRFLDNQFRLTALEVLVEFNGNRFHELPSNIQRQLKTHTLRCVLITKESHPEIKYEVFERLNTNTMPLNAQELRNCLYRGSLNSMLENASKYEPWLAILGRKTPDKRLRDEELILRFFAYQLHGLETYRTPQKLWLNNAAKAGQNYSDKKIQKLQSSWEHTIQVCLILFEPHECFRRDGSRAINRALFDLVADTARSLSEDKAKSIRGRFRKKYNTLLRNEEFLDLISRSVDHTKRTKRRFEIWSDRMADII